MFGIEAAARQGVGASLPSSRAKATKSDGPASAGRTPPIWDVPEGRPRCYISRSADHDESALPRCKSSKAGCNWTHGQGPGEMSSLIVARRQFLQGVASAAVCAPGIVRASSLMRISARHCVFAPPASLWATTQDALAVLQHEMERRFAETLFGAESLSAEAENGVPTRNSIVAGAKITALWELRTWFGSRGSPPKPFEELPAEVQASLFSMFGTPPTYPLNHGQGGFPASPRARALRAPFDNPSRSWDITQARSLDLDRG